MNAGEELTGKAEALLPGGEALIRVDGSTYLVANAVPGDFITFCPAEKRRGALRGELCSVAEPSAKRVDSPCPVAAQCGGCAMQFLDPAEHSDVKSTWVFDAFHGCQNTNTLNLPANPLCQTSRRRLRWYMGHDDGGAFLGFHAKASHSLVRHHDCMCATPTLNQLRKQLEMHAEVIAPTTFESVQAIELDDGIHLILESDTVPEGFTSPFSDAGGKPVQWWCRSSNKMLPLSRPVHAFHDLLPAGEGGDIALLVGPDDFIQGLNEGNCLLINQIIEWSEGANFVVDLFSGIGNLSLPVASAHGSKVVGAELNDASVRAANANAKRLNLSARYMQTNLFESFSVEPFAGADVLILDPPRRGAKKVCSMMGRLLPTKIIMVNCDVASGGRDGEMLQSLGYRLHTVRALDLFPYTGHVEAMSLWVR